MDRGWEIKEAPQGVQGKTIQDFLYFEGMYNPILRFAFTNVLDEEFRSYWNGNPYVIKPYETVKIPHYLACKFTKEIVDKMMLRDNAGLKMAVPANRKPYEDKVLSILPSEREQELEIIKNEFIGKVKLDASRPVGVPDEPIETPVLDFNNLRRKDFIGTSETPVETPETPVIVKRGRPKKS